jgi:RNA polymerase sigma-70 factor (ECF subfamily)
MESPDVDPLIAGLVAGDERAYVALYDQFAGRLGRTAMGIVRCREDAEDAVQEVFMGVLQSRHRLGNVQDLTAYLFTALRRAAGRAAARRVRGQALLEAAAGALPTAADRQDDSGSCSDQLQRALLALPDEQREVISLKIDGELTFAQIAQVIGVSVNTAASRYRYALERLRTSLEAFK